MSNITDVPGVKVGHCSNFNTGTGCTVIIFENPSLGAIDMRGGGTSTRQVDPLLRNSTYGKINAIFLTGGSAFGLDASGGVLSFLEERGIGLNVGSTVVPSVPSAVIFDLGIGDRNVRPDAEMGYKACLNATDSDFREGTIGVGTGATVGKILGINNATKGGVGSLSFSFQDEVEVGVFVVVNAFGDVVSLKNNEIVAGVRGEDGQFLGTVDLIKRGVKKTYEPFSSTTLAVAVTNALLTKDELYRVAKIGQTGIARVVNPANTISDGDIVFAVSVGDKEGDANAIGVVSAELISESINRAVINAEGLFGIPSFSDLKK